MTREEMQEVFEKLLSYSEESLPYVEQIQFESVKYKAPVDLPFM